MDAKELFAKAVEAGGGCIHHIKAEQLTNDTPCSEWDLKTLVNHMVYELRWVPDLLMGKTVAEVGTAYDGDLLGTDLQAAWQHAADAALVAVKQVDLSATVHLSYGDKPAEGYIAEMAADMLIHGWDVGQSMNCNVIFDEAVATEIYTRLAPDIEGWREAGAVGPAVEVAPDADIQTKLLAMMGRSAKK